VSNLSDLLPAGAAAKQLTFTDSGSGIATKKPVILNSDGTVTEVGITSQSASFGSTADYDTDRAYYPSVVHDTASGNNVICYRDSGNNSYGTARVVSVSGSTLTFGTAVVFSSVHCDYISADYDASQNKILIGFRDDTYSRLRAVVGTVSGTSISFGSDTLIDGYQGYRMKVAYNAAASASLLVFSYAESGGYSNYPYGCVATISGTSVSFGTKVRIESTGAEMSWNTNVYDVASTKNLVAYRSGSGARASVATISGTSVSFGTHVDWTTDTTDYLVGVYDPTTSKTAIFYRNNSQSYYLYYVVGTVSGTSVSFGSQAAAESSGNDYDISASFDTSVNKHIIGFTLDGGADQYRWLIEGTMSGTTMSFTTKVSADNGNNEQYDAAQCYDPVAQKSLLAITDNTTTTAYMRTYTASGSVANLSAQAFVGVADSAISASAAGSIIVQGGTVTGVEVDPAVTTGSQVVFDDGGATTQISSAFDPDNNKVVHAFCTTVAHAIVGTVSGTSVTYGTAVQINTNASSYTSTAYDTANDRVVIVYSDNGDSYGYASVGTVSGTSITFGTKVVFSTLSSNQKSIVYDANAGKVLIVYRDGGGGDEVKGIVGTVDPSDNSITFGSAATAAATQNFNLAAVYDSNAQKTVVVAQDYTDSTGTAYVATITGTSVSFGTGVDFLAAAVNNNALSVTFNSTDNKVIVGYGKASDNKGYLITGTVSGTSISFAGETAFSSDTTTNYISLAYKAAGNILGIVYNVSGSSKIRFNNAVISGTSFSFGTEQDLVATTTDTTALILDETANNFVASYGDGSNNYDGTTNVVSVSTSAVIGTKYYVTTSGGFSSSADTPSVNAGLAISTTSLLLNGDS